MGNNSTKESRGPDSPFANSHRHPESNGASGPASPTDRNHPYTSRGTRGGRPDLSFLGLGSSNNEVPERRETKQEREARKLEKERLARIKERERSIKEEHVDGGYLVTMGVYTGHEDFNKSVVRQLMIERRIAPFWRGLEDFKEEWTEHQLVAAGRGLPIPAADEIPQEDGNPLSPDSPHASNPNLQSLMVPITERSPSAVSDTSATLSPSHPAFSLPSPTSPVGSSPPHSSSPFRPRSKTVASLSSSSKNPSSSDMTPREIQLPNDPYVNGQHLEVFLYKDASECPICFLYYPPYLNKTRCCDQSICSECFVQIKRPDPHPPEHEHNDPSQPPPPPADTSIEADSLVSEPSTCPYCQAPEFGVTYDPPPFRRGLSYANMPHGLTSISSAMSSSSSLNSTGGPAVIPNTHKRRTTSISANAPTVITTDRIRPDWSTKLANARNHLARRSAAATALHTAAYLMGNGSNDSRGFGFGSRSRFGRNRGDNSPGASGAATPSPTSAEPGSRSVGDQISQMRREVQEGGSSRRRTRMEDLEDMMMMEAIRLSLAAEEERKRKAEKEAAKEAKKKAKEDKKREKRERKVYGSGASSASGSALSLSLPILNRRRGNSGSSNLAREVTPENAEPTDTKGKGVDRTVGHSAPMDFSRGESSLGHGIPGARHLDTGTLTMIENLQQPSPSPTAPDRPSHLRHMSNASSPASSFIESAHGSMRNDFHGHGSSSTLESQNASAANLAGHSNGTPDGDDANGGAGQEPMFNFQSLAAMIGNEDGDSDDKIDAAKHIEYLNGGESSAVKSQEENPVSTLEESVATLRVENPNTSSTSSKEDTRQTTLLQPQRTTPEVMLTPETPAAVSHREDEGKQLGSNWSESTSTREITQ
ncbi:hypothetical protein G7Y89_g2131 [Cudoniella acicularis]|uniref:Protein sip5 n=1 Tax=Cudoniella acicularis TaxID=354080 RepID=A0A8H4RVP2_9HELO|nr:hypothetical protein G7Y89_g2131 [Cudoniella acicularis]